MTWTELKIAVEHAIKKIGSQGSIVASVFASEPCGLRLEPHMRWHFCHDHFNVKLSQPHNKTPSTYTGTKTADVILMTSLIKCCFIQNIYV